MSLHTIVSDGLAGRPLQRPAGTAVAQPHHGPLAVLLTGMSMRFLETSLAAMAIVVAVLMGLGR